MILYINNEYCTSVEQLKSYFIDNITPDSDIYVDLLDYGRHGDMAAWLREIGEYEMASRVESIVDNLADSAYFAQLKSAITGESTESSDQLKPSFDKCLSLTKVSPSYNKNVCTIELRLKVLTSVNESYTIQINSDKYIGGLSSVKTINPSDYQKDELIKLVFELYRPNLSGSFLSSFYKGAEFSIIVDNLLVYTNKSFIEKCKGSEFTMIRVPSGDFLMGEDPVIHPYNRGHLVSLPNEYYIGETVVTQGLWQAVMKNKPEWNNLDYPVVNISMDECLLFIKELNKITGKHYRLPTEAEWEYAAKGAEKSRKNKFSGSDAAEEVAWISYNSDKKLHKVKEKKTNEIGLYDMSGNVFEMCFDIFGYHPESPQVDPIGSLYGSKYVLKGGCFELPDGFCEPSCRSHSLLFDYKGNNSTGFRLVLSDKTAEDLINERNRLRSYFEAMLLEKKHFEDYYTDNTIISYYKNKFDEIGEPLKVFRWNRINEKYDVSKPYLSVKKNGKWGWINPQCEFIIPAEYDSCFVTCYEGIVELTKNGFEGALNIDTGQIVIPFKYRSITSLFEDIYAVSDHQTGLYAIVKAGPIYMKGHVYSSFRKTSTPYVFEYVKYSYTGKRIEGRIDVRTASYI